MNMRYDEMQKGSGRLTLDLTEQNAKDFWRLAHAIQHDLKHDPHTPEDVPLEQALITGLMVAITKPLEQYPTPRTLPMTLRRQPPQSEVERLEQPVVALHPHKPDPKPLTDLLGDDLSGKTS